MHQRVSGANQGVAPPASPGQTSGTRVVCTAFRDCCEALRRNCCEALRRETFPSGLTTFSDPQRPLRVRLSCQILNTSRGLGQLGVLHATLASSVPAVVRLNPYVVQQHLAPAEKLYDVVQHGFSYVVIRRRRDPHGQVADGEKRAWGRKAAAVAAATIRRRVAGKITIKSKDARRPRR
jgi:hypothetical protein